MLKISVVYKLGAAIMLIMLSVLLPLGFIINRVFTNFYITNTEADIEVLSHKYAQYTTSLNDPMLLTMYDGLAELTHNDIVITNKSGRNIVNSGIARFRVNQKDFKMLAQGQSVKRSYTTVNGQNQYLVAASPIQNDGTFVGAIYVFAPMDKVYESLDKIHSSLILASIGAVFLALGFTYFLSRRLSQPLLAMESATKKIAHGNLSTRVVVPSKDELGSLALAINDLAIELDRYRTNRREFFANISHELRTPITYLSGYANVLKNNLYKTEEESQQYLKIIEEEAGRLNQLINDLFDLAKMEEGRLDLNFESIDLNNVLKNIISKVKFQADKKDLKIHFDATKKRHTILGDLLRLEQIFTNLLNNAVRYTEKGRIDVSIEDTDNEKNVFIRDTGPGIPSNEKDQIFERFYRVEKSRSRNTGGTGLGLAIVKQLVVLHEGRIDVESEVGKGTLFILTFPRTEGGNNDEMV